MHRTSLRLKSGGILVLLSALAGAASAQSPPAHLTARQVVQRIQQEVGAPAPSDTVDTFKAGDPDTPVTGIVTTFLDTYEVLQKAAAAGANLIITHEPTFYNHRDDTSFFVADPVFTQKMAFIREHHLVVWRFHDLWHERKPDGIVQGFTEAVGWEKYQNPQQQILFTLPRTTVGELAADLRNKLHARSVRIVGDPRMQITQLAYLPGASGEEKQVQALRRNDVQLLVAGESAEWETVEYVRDAVAQGRQKALILLGHEVSEEPGMEYCARWLRPLFPGVPVTFIPAGEPFQTIQRRP